jgi:TgpA N-terminal domain/Transglutaminase-like superfamily
MGVLLFITVLVGSIYWMRSLFLARADHNSASRREAFLLGYPHASMSEEPIVTPVDQEKKIPARLPQVAMDFVPLESIASKQRTSRISNDRSFQLIVAKSLPLPIEESLLYRTLVCVLFAIAAISMDLAAGTHYGWLGIPFTIAGSAWSWHRRHHGKHWLNRVVSIASLAIVLMCVLPLFYDTHLAIERINPVLNPMAPPPPNLAAIAVSFGVLLVLIQLALSFQFYNRRMLGRSVVTSTLLLSAAAYLGNSITFVILCCGFIALVIATLMLDYRSQLELKPIGIADTPMPGHLPPRHLPWRYLSQLAAIAIGLGLIIALFLPGLRLPNFAFIPQGIDKFQQMAETPPASTGNSQISPDALKDIVSKVLGQAGNNNYPDSIKQENLQLPPELASQLQQFAQQILATSPQPLNSDFDRAAYLGEYLKQHYQADPSQADPDKLPPLTAKSIQELVEKYQSTTPSDCKIGGNSRDIPVIHTAMLRSIGIPARMKTGDQVAQIDPQTKLYSRPPATTPSQTEMYAPSWGWMGMDATPNSPNTPNQDRPLLNLTQQQIAQLQSQLKQMGLSVASSANPTPSPMPAASPSAGSNQDNSKPASNNSDHSAFNQSANPDRSTQTPTPPLELPKWMTDPAVLKMIVIAIGIISGICWYFLYYRQQQQALAKLHPIERVYRSMLTSLSKTSRSKLPVQTQLEYAASIKTTEHPQVATVVAEISQLYTAWRYGKQRIDLQALSKKLQHLNHLQQLTTKRKRQQWFTHQKLRWTPANPTKPPKL